MRSIRKYLLIYSFLVAVITALIASYFTYKIAYLESNEVYDQNLKQIAITLKNQYAFIGSPKKNKKVKNAISGKLDEEEEYIIQVRDKNYELIYTSYPSIKVPETKEGLHTIEFNGRYWHSYKAKADYGSIQVSQPKDNRNAIINAFSKKIILPLLLQIPIIIILIGLFINKGLKPLSELSEAINKRDANSLLPITLENISTELVEPVNELNELLLRLGNSLEQQKQFIADAAHELRTPLTAIQLQLNILERAETNAEKIQATSKLSLGIKRCIELVEQLLLMAKTEFENANLPSVDFDLSELLKNLTKEYEPLSEEKNIELSLSLENNVIINGNERNTYIMISNLLNNAIIYTPEKGRIIIDLTKENAGITLKISDNGIGIASDERERIFDRFYRIPGYKVNGTGLGLSVVKSIADRYRIKVEVGVGIQGKGTSFTCYFLGFSKQ